MSMPDIPSPGELIRKFESLFDVCWTYFPYIFTGLMVLLLIIWIRLFI